MTPAEGPYRVRLTSTDHHLRHGAVASEWLGPRAIAEASPWPLLRLGGNHVRPTPEHIREAAARAAANPAYPHTMGLPELRSAIADRVGAELGYALNPESQVLITCGSMQAIYLALNVTTDRSHGAVGHAPSFCYADLAAFCGVPFRWVQGLGRIPDWQAYSQAIRDDTKLAIVNTPCNPTGYVFTERDLDGLARAVHAQDVWILADEALLTYVYDEHRHRSPALIPELRDRTVIVRSFSKMFGMGPWRVGYAVGPEPIIAAMAKALQWMVIGVDSVAQAAALAALTGPQGWVRDIVNELGSIRLKAVGAINQGHSLRAETPQAGAVLWGRLRRASSLSEEEASRSLGQRYAIPAVPGRRFGADQPHLRIPFGGAAEDVGALLQRLPEVDLLQASEPA